MYKYDFSHTKNDCKQELETSLISLNMDWISFQFQQW